MSEKNCPVIDSKLESNGNKLYEFLKQKFPKEFIIDSRKIKDNCVISISFTNQFRNQTYTVSYYNSYTCEEGKVMFVSIDDLIEFINTSNPDENIMKMY